HDFLGSARLCRLGLGGGPGGQSTLTHAAGRLSRPRMASRAAAPFTRPPLIQCPPPVTLKFALGRTNHGHRHLAVTLRTGPRTGRLAQAPAGALRKAPRRRPRPASAAGG